MVGKVRNKNDVKAPGAFELVFILTVSRVIIYNFVCLFNENFVGLPQFLFTEFDLLLNF